MNIQRPLLIILLFLSMLNAFFIPQKAEGVGLVTAVVASAPIWAGIPILHRGIEDHWLWGCGYAKHIESDDKKEDGGTWVSIKNETKYPLTFSVQQNYPGCKWLNGLGEELIEHQFTIMPDREGYQYAEDYTRLCPQGSELKLIDNPLVMNPDVSADNPSSEGDSVAAVYKINVKDIVKASVGREEGLIKLGKNHRIRLEWRAGYLLRTGLQITVYYSAEKAFENDKLLDGDLPNNVLPTPIGGRFMDF